MSQSLSLLYLFGESAERDADPWRRRAVQLMTAFGGRTRQVAAVDKLPNGVPGLAARMPILFSEGVVKGRIDLPTFVASALSPSLPALVVFRFLAGTFGGCPITIGAGSFGDLIRPRSRGKVIAIWSLGPIVSN